MDFDENTPSYDASKIAAALIANGYAPVPVAKGEKRPIPKDWPNKSFSADDFLPGMNVGIRCGDAQVALLDIDVYCESVVSEIIAEWNERFGDRGRKMQRVGEAPKVGIPFKTDEGATKKVQSIRPTGKSPRQNNGKQKDEKVEILTTGQQFVAYGIHPDTKQPYHWRALDPMNVDNGRAEDLPYVSSDELADFLALVADKFGPEEQPLPLSQRAKPLVGKKIDLHKGYVVEAFNEANNLTDLMRRYGYTHRREAHWTSPKSGTGSANVQVIGDRWRSLSGSDAAAGIGAETKGGIRSGDAFDLFVAFEHGGNFSAAVRSYAQTLRMQIKPEQPSLRSYEELLEAAKALMPGQIEDMEAIVSSSAALKPMRRDAIYRAIKSATGVSLTTIREHTALEHASPAPDHLDIARMALEQIGLENIICAEGFVWRWQERGVWVLQDDRAIKQVIQTRVDEEPRIDVTASLVNSVCDVLKSEIYRSKHEFNLGNPETVNCMNGELAMDKTFNWQLQPHCRENYRTTQIPVAYDKQSDAPLFRTFLNEVFRDDSDKQEKISAVLELMGYTLMSHARHERFVMLIGPGANGKSVLLAILEGLLGSGNVAGVQPSNFDNRFQRAHLHQKLANIVTELKQGEVIADAELKAITSGEPATVEHKHRDPFVMRPFATCWFGTNHMPHTRDFSQALFRRATILQFNRVFTKEEQDPLLKEKILAELPGILNMALNAYAVGVVHGFTVPASSELAKTEWRLEADQVAQFVEEACRTGTDMRSAIGDVYRVYKEWANQNGIRQTMSQKGLRDRLTRLGFGAQKAGSTRYVTGITLRCFF